MIKNFRKVGYLKYIDEACSEEIKKIAEEFWSKCEELDINWEYPSNKECINQAAFTLLVLTQNIRPEECLSEEAIASIKGMIEEIENDLKSLVRSKDGEQEKTASSAYKIQGKLHLIYEFLSWNMITHRELSGLESGYIGKVFDDYRNIYLIVSLINNNYDELLAKGFRADSVLMPFARIIKINKFDGIEFSEEEKLQMFLGLINGTMRFNYGVVPITDNFINSGEIFTTVPISKLYLPKTSVEYSFADEGPKRELIKKENVE